MLIDSLKNLNFFIAGAGLSGIAIAKLLKKNAVNVFITEAKSISDAIKLELSEQKISFEENGHNLINLIKNCHILIISPGIPLNTELVLTCKRNKIPVISEIEAASWFAKPKCNIIGITGTNGKSTTTHYLAQLLNKKYKAMPCGNIGISLAQTITEYPDIDTFVIELSSYQLESTYSVRPFCSIFLNIQNDHLLRYENITEYLKAKWRLVALTADNGIVIIDKNVLNLALHIGLSLPRAQIIVVEDKTNSNATLLPLKSNYDIFNFSKTLPIAFYKELRDLNLESVLLPTLYHSAYANYSENGSISISYHSDNHKINWHIQNPCLPGKHNMLNIFVASICALHMNIPENIILAQWEEKTSDYKHLPHRLEKISAGYNVYTDENNKNKNILIINDSKATNVESTLVAIASFQQPIRLLLGGEAKGDSYLPISSFLGKNIIKIYPFGQAASTISNELSQYKNYLAKESLNLISAANLALNEANNNEIILLSPACSSFDEFKNFEHRGDIFREWALLHLKDKIK